jgi:hypothetical protein
MEAFNEDMLYQILNLLEELLRMENAPHVELVICGGSALIATGLVRRTTRDVDVVAMMAEDMKLIDPEPFPPALKKAAKKVAASMGLPSDWLNSGPSDIFRMGLPEGFSGRLEKHIIGQCLTVYFINRLDQIYFKLYASVDRGGYHVDDLMAMKPTSEELAAASKWSMTHDVSEGYTAMLKDLLKRLGYEDAATQI